MDESELETQEAFDEELKSRQYICPTCQKKFTLPIFVSQTNYVYTVLVTDPVTHQKLHRKCCSYTCYRKAQQTSIKNHS